MPPRGIRRLGPETERRRLSSTSGTVRVILHLHVRVPTFLFCRVQILRSRGVGSAHLISSDSTLAGVMQNLLDASLDLSVATSLRNISVKYNIINRLWSIVFYRHLENLRRAAFAVPAHAVAFQLLQESIGYAYTSCTSSVEERTLEALAGNWLRYIGDLAWYRMAVATMAGTVSPLGACAGAGLDGRSLVAILRAAADLTSPSLLATGAKSPNPSQLPSVSQQREVGDSAEDHDGSIRSVSDELVGHGREQGPGGEGTDRR
jgi:protein SMG6